MPRLFVGLTLKPGVDRDAYERWALDRDAPVVRALEAVEAFTVHRITGALAGEPPFDYLEIVEVSDMNAFGSEITTEPMNTVAGELSGYAENVMFMVSEPLEPHESLEPRK